MSLQFIFLLLALLGLAFFLWRAFQKREESRARTIDNMWPGGVLTLRHIGQDYEEMDAVVKARHHYVEGSYRWIELECESGKGTVWITVEKDDELEVSISLRKLRLRDLGLEETAFQAEEHPFAFTFEDALYDFQETGTADFFRDGDPENRESFTYWEFHCDTKERDIAIERWDSGGVECHLSQRLNPHQYMVYSMSGDTGP